MIADRIADGCLGIFLLAAGVRRRRHWRDMWDAVMTVLWFFQGIYSLGYAFWPYDPIWQRMNLFTPQYMEIVAFGWLAFYARVLRKS
jgi:hypothetical protein